MNKPVNRKEYDGHSGAVIERSNVYLMVSPSVNGALKLGYVNPKGRRGKTAKSKAFGRGRTGDVSTHSNAGVVHKVIIRSHVRVDDRFYWFRRPTTITLIRTASHLIARIGRDGSFPVTGRGRNERQAMRSLSQNVDQQIQRLYRCLPMQLSGKEQATLRALESLFDLDRFRRSIRTEAIEVAVFSRLNDLFRFDCFGGPIIEINSQRCSGLFGSLKDGDWCEIAVRKRLQDATVESIQFRRLVDKPQMLLDDEFQRELSELPKADFPPLPDGPIRST